MERAPWRRREGKALKLEPDAAERARAKLLGRRSVNGNGCWEWQGYCDPDGYGRLRFEGWKGLAHRLAHAAFVAPLKRGEDVLHSCDNPPCFNPAHLRAGTPSENVLESWERTRGGDEFPEDPPF